jgi:hypothetical protein
VNNDLKDLRNQLYLLTEEKDTAFKDSLGIASLRDTLARAQRTFTEWTKQDKTHETSQLLEKLGSAFFTLLAKPGVRPSESIYLTTGEVLDSPDKLYILGFCLNTNHANDAWSSMCPNRGTESNH